LKTPLNRDNKNKQGIIISPAKQLKWKTLVIRQNLIW